MANEERGKYTMSLFGKVMDFVSRTVGMLCEVKDDGLRMRFILSVDAYRDIEKKIGAYKQKTLECGEFFGFPFVVDSETVTPIKQMVWPKECEVNHV